MFVHTAAQPQEETSSVPLDLRPPVQAESIDLRALVSHRTATQSRATMEAVFEIFKNGGVNFVARLDCDRLLGMCSRQETAALLSGRYGFALGARADCTASLQARNTHQSCDAKSETSCALCLRVQIRISTMMCC
jgi:hypothetical protein